VYHLVHKAQEQRLAGKSGENAFAACTRAVEKTAWSYPGSLPALSSLECMKNKDVKLPVFHLTTAFGTHKLWEILRLPLTSCLSPVFLHISNVS